MTRWILAFALLGAAHTASAQSTCEERCKVGSVYQCEAHCADEALHTLYAGTYWNEKISGYPTTSPACRRMPNIYMYPRSGIQARCNQNPEHRDQYSCGDPQPDGSYSLLLDTSLPNAERWYWFRFQMGKFHAWCSGYGITEWDENHRATWDPPEYDLFPFGAESSLATDPPQSCLDRVTGFEDGDAYEFCQTERDHYNQAYNDFVAKHNVRPIDHVNCWGQDGGGWGSPLVNMLSFDHIRRSCNQSPTRGRDISSCGQLVDGRWSIALNGQTNMFNRFRFYRIQLYKFFWECTGMEGSWPWQDIPIEWQ